MVPVVVIRLEVLTFLLMFGYTLQGAHGSMVLGRPCRLQEVFDIWQRDPGCWSIAKALVLACSDDEWLGSCPFSGTGIILSLISASWWGLQGFKIYNVLSSSKLLSWPELDCFKWSQPIFGYVDTHDYEQRLHFLLMILE
jgi:hypothetical protein